MTQTSLTCRTALALLAMSAGTITGCCCYEGSGVPGPGYSQCMYYNGPPMCHGYYSTCWRPWPVECPPCPAFAAAIPLAEPIGMPPGKSPIMSPSDLPPGGLPAPSTFPAPPLPGGTLNEAPPSPTGAFVPFPNNNSLAANKGLAADHGLTADSDAASSRRHWVQAEFSARALTTPVSAIEQPIAAQPENR